MAHPSGRLDGINVYNRVGENEATGKTKYEATLPGKPCAADVVE